MKTKVIEATDQINWGRFMVGVLDHEREAVSQVDGMPVCGRRWDQRTIFVMDLVTGEGAMFGPWGLAAADLQKHAIWVCPLFEPWLEWLYARHPFTLDELPAVVNLDPTVTAKHNALSGYRRAGPSAEERAQVEKSA